LVCRARRTAGNRESVICPEGERMAWRQSVRFVAETDFPSCASSVPVWHSHQSSTQSRLSPEPVRKCIKCSSLCCIWMRLRRVAGPTLNQRVEGSSPSGGITPASAGVFRAPTESHSEPLRTKTPRFVGFLLPVAAEASPSWCGLGAAVRGCVAGCAAASSTPAARLKWASRACQ
jgi:hypothetical protein